jgi:hypothetical protein
LNPFVMVASLQAGTERRSRFCEAASKLNSCQPHQEATHDLRLTLSVELANPNAMRGVPHVIHIEQARLLEAIRRWYRITLHSHLHLLPRLGSVHHLYHLCFPLFLCNGRGNPDGVAKPKRFPVHILVVASLSSSISKIFHATIVSSRNFESYFVLYLAITYGRHNAE